MVLPIVFPRLPAETCCCLLLWASYGNCACFEAQLSCHRIFGSQFPLFECRSVFTNLTIMLSLVSPYLALSGMDLCNANLTYWWIQSGGAQELKLPRSCTPFTPPPLQRSYLPLDPPRALPWSLQTFIACFFLPKQLVPAQLHIIPAGKYDMPSLHANVCFCSLYA